MKRQVTAALSALLIAAGALTVTAPASADSSCPSGATCLWQDANYKGGKFTFYRYAPDLSEWHFDNGVNVDNRTSSVWNNGNYESVCLFADYSGHGRSFRLAKGTWQDNLLWRRFNDMTSSAYFAGYKSC